MTTASFFVALAAGAWIGVATIAAMGIKPRGSLVWAAIVTAVAVMYLVRVTR